MAQADANTWRDRATKVRQDVRDRIATAQAPAAGSAEAARRRMLGFDDLAAAKLDAAKDLIGKVRKLGPCP